LFANEKAHGPGNGPWHEERALAQAEIGIIGGSGLYSMPGFTNVREERVETPFGEPSDAFVLGELEGRKVAFLARHGRGHRILPSELNFRANIYAFKKLGVGRIVSLSAVGSLKEEHKPTDFVIPDQFIDRTTNRTPPSLEKALWAMSALPIRSARRWPRPRPKPAPRWAWKDTWAAPMYAWKGRSSPPRRNRTCTAVGART
jgi:hypothetical protein